MSRPKRKSGGRPHIPKAEPDDDMKARIIPIDDIARLSDEQKARIIATAYAGPKNYLQRANELQRMAFCTDDVKFQVLRESRLISEDLYNCIYDIYFGNVRHDAAETPDDTPSAAETPDNTPTAADTPSDTPSDTPTAAVAENATTTDGAKRAYTQRMTDEETVELINFYLDGASYEDIAQRFGRTAAQIKAKIRDEKKKGKHKDMFNDRITPTKAPETPDTERDKRFEEIIKSVDAGSQRHEKPEMEEVPKLSEKPTGSEKPKCCDGVPKSLTARGIGFLTTEGGLKLDEEPLTAALRQKLIELGIVQLYAEVEITIRPTVPAGMVVNVEE